MNVSFLGQKNVCLESEKCLCRKLTALIFSRQRQISVMGTSILHKLISSKLGFLAYKDRAQDRRFSDKKESNRPSSLLKRNSGRVIGNIQRSSPQTRGQALRSQRTWEPGLEK